MRVYLTVTLAASIALIAASLAGADIRPFILSPFPGIVAAVCVLIGYRREFKIWHWPLLLIVGGVLNYGVVLFAVILNTENQLGVFGLLLASATGGVLWASVLRITVFGAALKHRFIVLAGIFCSLAVLPLLVGEVLEGRSFWLALHTSAWWMFFALILVFGLNSKGTNTSLQQTGGKPPPSDPHKCGPVRSVLYIMRLVVILLAAGLFGCGGSNQDIESRVKYWENELSILIEPGIDLKQALEVVATLDPEATYSSEERAVILMLERIDDTSIACSEWMILGRLSFENGQFKRADVEGLGVCT